MSGPPAGAPPTGPGAGRSVHPSTDDRTGAGCLDGDMDSRPTLRDVTVSACFLALGVLLIRVVPGARVAWPGDLPLPPWWVELAWLMIVFAGSTLRRTRPLTGLVVLSVSLVLGALVIGHINPAALLAFGDVLYCAVLYGPARIGAAVAGLATVMLAVGVTGSFLFGGPLSGPQLAINVFLVLGIPVAWAREVRANRERIERERERAALAVETADLARAAAVADERGSMARDLHDVIAGQLCSIAMQTEVARVADGDDPVKLQDTLRSIRRESMSALDEMRTMIELLRADGAARDDPHVAPPRLDDLDRLVHAGRQVGLDVVVEDERRPARPVPVAVSLAAFRIIQESLTNAAKHAPRSSVRLALAEDEENLQLTIENDLPVRPVHPDGTGIGLLSLRERSKAVGGKLSAGPAAHRWRVFATLPIGAAEADR